MKPIQNAKQLPKRYFGMHFVPGTAEYSPPDSDPYRIFVNEATIKKMDASFEGRPVYVKHVANVNLANIQEDADGYVVRSFFNASDGKHWVEFLVVSDRAHSAIQAGWRLSNAYHPTSLAPGGLHNGVQYDQEVTDGEYDHLAIVDDPRYEESVIMTPEQFKEYNLKKELELQKLSNSKDEPPKQGERKMGFSLWKKAKIENAVDLESTMVQLPLSKKEMTLANALTELDKVLNMHGYASPDHMVKLSDSEEMSVKELMDCYGKMKSSMDEEEKKKNEQDEKKEPTEQNEADEPPAGEGDMNNAEDEEEKKKNAAADGEEKKEPDLSNKKKNSSDKKTPKNKDHFEDLLNAADKASVEENVIEILTNQVARGKNRYGSIA